MPKRQKTYKAGHDLIGVPLFNKKIGILRDVSTTDEFNITRTKRAVVCEIWANVYKAKSKDNFVGDTQYLPENKIFANIRFTKDIYTSDNILFDGKVYNILDIENVNFENMVLKLTCVEVIK